MLLLSVPPVLQLHIAPNKEINQDIKRNWEGNTPPPPLSYPQCSHFNLFGTLSLVNVFYSLAFVKICQDLSRLSSVLMGGGGINYWLLPLLPSNSLHKERRRGSEPRPLGIDWRPGLPFHSHQPRGGDTLLSRSKIATSISGL